MALTVALASLASPKEVLANRKYECQTYWITGYASSEFPGKTADGTPTLGNEWSIVAVDPRVIPLGEDVWIEGLGKLRAADTGGGVHGLHIDVLVSIPSQAYALTGYRLVCRVYPKPQKGKMNHLAIEY